MMNRKQRKAKLAKAKQHQEYAASPIYQERQSKKYREDLDRYNLEYEQFEIGYYGGTKPERRLKKIKAVVCILVFVVLMFGISKL